MRSPADDLSEVLADNAVGVIGANAGWSINVGIEPSSPETAITLYDTGGLEPDTDKMEVFRPSIQVRVRGFSYRDGYAKQQEIRALLVALAPFTKEGSRYGGITASSEILAIGRDDNDRVLFTANYRVLREPAI